MHLPLSDANREGSARIREIGAPSEATKVTGNVKFDQHFPSFTRRILMKWHTLWTPGDETIFIAGSTHSGEEESW